VAPAADAKLEDHVAFQRKLGAPDKAEGYVLPLPDGADPALAKAAAGWMAELGVQPYAAAGLVERFNAHMAGVIEQQQATAAADLARAVESDVLSVRSEWGASYDHNRGIAESAIVKLVVPFVPVGKDVAPAEQAAVRSAKAAEVVGALRSSMGQAAMMRMFHAMGKGFATGQPHGIGASGGAGAGQPSLADKLYPNGGG
jgi:hypothetical protein